jgi:hypothetical protein
MSGKRFIHYSAIEKDSDYHKSVIDFYRGEAARAIQFAARLSILKFELAFAKVYLTTHLPKILKEHAVKKLVILCANNQLYTLRVKKNGKQMISPIVRHDANAEQYDILLTLVSSLSRDSIKFVGPYRRHLVRSVLCTTQEMMEPIDISVSQAIATTIKALRYEDLDFGLAEFTLHLFSALRANLITMNEMMTAKLLCEGLLCFKQTKLNRHMFGDIDSPYQPENNLVGWGGRQNSALEKENIASRLYYTIDLPKYVHAGLLYYYLDKISQFDEREMIRLRSMIMAYSDLLYNSIKDKDWFEKTFPDILKNLIIETSAGKEFFQKISLCRFNKDSKQSIENIQFIVASGLDAAFPFVCFTGENKQTLSIALPTIDALNALNRMVHAQDAVLPTATVGAATTRQIRAYTEALGNISETTATYEVLKVLYPAAATLTQPARIVEITIPGMLHTQCPHGYDCHDFMLILHDLFHTWANSAQFKGFFALLRKISDEKDGFADNRSGMSKSLWLLTDMGFNTGERQRLLDGHYDDFYMAKLYILQGSGFDFSTKHDDNYLILYYEYHNKDQWASHFLKNPFDDVLIMVAPIIGYYSDEAKNFLSSLMIERTKFVKYLTLNPHASVVEFILQDLLGSASDVDKEPMFFLVKNNYLKDIFTWTPNDGIYFKKDVYENYYLSTLGLSRKLRTPENTPQVLQHALKVIKNFYEIKMPCPLTIYKESFFSSSVSSACCPKAADDGTHDQSSWPSCIFIRRGI